MSKDKKTKEINEISFDCFFYYLNCYRLLMVLKNIYFKYFPLIIITCFNKSKSKSR